MLLLLLLLDCTDCYVSESYKLFLRISTSCVPDNMTTTTDYTTIQPSEMNPGN